VTTAPSTSLPSRMSNSHGLSDEQVSNELKRMVAFIKQEAIEKSREIHIKADEEFAIEKAKLVRQETSQIDAQYDGRYKHASMAQQISASNLTNRSRLRVLNARQEVLDGIFEDARTKLPDIQKDKTAYADLLKNLILEGLYALMEKAVFIRARKADNDLVENASKEAAAEFEKTAGFPIETEIDADNPLGAESAGGVVVLGLGGKIEYDNTLEERLKLLESSSLPKMRASIFGASPSRKFFD